MRYTHTLLALSIASILHAQTPVFQWADGVGNIETPGFAAGIGSLSVADDGSVYIAAGMHGPHMIIGDTLVGSSILARFDTQGELLWAKAPGGDVATYGSNAVYVAGGFTGTLQFDAITLTADSVDAYVAKYDASGDLQWVQQMGGAGSDVAHSVAVDGLGRVHVAGRFQGTATFGTATLVATHDTSGFVATYDANGAFQWAAICGGLNASPDYISPRMEVDADDAGNTFVSSVFDGTGTFGATTLTADDYDDIFLACFDVNGTCTWVRKMGSFSGNEVHGVGVTPSGNVFIYGAYWGEPATFCGPALPNSNFGNLETFLAMYDGGGSCQWAQRVAPCFFNDFPGNLEVDDLGNAWIAGSFSGTSGQFGSLTLAGGGQYVARYDETGTATLAERLNTATYDFIGLGASGDLYLGGYISSSTVFDMDAGTNVFPRMAQAEMGFLAHYDATHDFEWVQQIGPHGIAYDGCAAIALDAGGNVYTTGYYSGSAIFCSDTLHAWLAGSSIFISKRDADGDCIWTRSIGDRGAFGGSALNLGQSIAIDGSDIYVSGKFADSVRFGATQLVSAGGTDLFLAKYDANGNCIWAKGGGGPGEDQGLAVAVDGNHNVTIAGLYTATATIAGSTFTSQGYADAFLARYDATGNVLWSHTMGGTGWEECNDLTVDDQGNSYFTGRFSTSADFGTITITGTGDADLYVAKYDPSGDPLWVNSTSGAGWKSGTSVVQNVTGNIYVTGSFYGTADFCTSDLAGDAVDNHAFLACYSSDGEELWAQQLETTGTSHGAGLSARPGGNIILTGDLYGSSTIGGTTLTSASFSDVLLAAFEPDGAALWAQSFGGTGTWDLSVGGGTAADANDVYVVGTYGGVLFDAFTQGGSITFEPGDPLSTVDAPNALDTYVAKYSVTETTNIPPDPLGCDGTTSIEEVGPIDLVISPNPVDRFFTVTDVAIGGDAHITVRDMSGREVPVTSTIRSGYALIDASALAIGAYTIHLHTVHVDRTGRFVKQ